MRDAGLKPDVDDVLFFFERAGAAARAPEIVRKKGVDGIAPPTVGARFAKPFGSRTGDAGVQRRLAARGADDRGNGRAPRALTRDAPLRMILEHLLDARLTPRRRPAHVANILDRPFAQAVLIHGDEPLRRRA